jgi:hypothetical protein
MIITVESGYGLVYEIEIDEMDIDTAKQPLSLIMSQIGKHLPSMLELRKQQVDDFTSKLP